MSTWIPWRDESYEILQHEGGGHSHVVRLFDTRIKWSHWHTGGDVCHSHVKDGQDVFDALCSLGRLK